MRRSFAFALVLTAAVLTAAPVVAGEQTIQELTPPIEQQVEILGTDEAEQRVEVVSGDAEQIVAEHVPPTATAKAASTTGKFFLGVASAGVALGVMAASLLLL